MGRLRVHTLSGLRWPNKCAFCGNVPNAEAYASLNKYGDLRYYFFYFQWLRETHDVSYPVCQKHKRLASILNKPYEFGFFNSFMVLGFLPALILLAVVFGIVELLAIPKQTASSVVDFTVTWTFVLPTLFFASCYFFRPVKLSKISDSSIILTIRREEYLEEFKFLNKGIIENSFSVSLRS